MQEATRLVVLATFVAAALGLGVGASASRAAAPEPAAAAAEPESEPAAAAPEPAAAAAAESEPAAGPAEEGWGDQKIQGARSRAPATGSSYNWRQMAFAGGIVLVTGLLVAWLVRRQTRPRG